VKGKNGIARRGQITLICGPMFSGKTEMLLTLMADARAQSMALAAFKHARDDRYDGQELVTHSGQRTAARAVASAAEIPELARGARLVVIDEAQFFGIDLVEACQKLAEDGRRVVVAGLDLDSWGEPFGPVPYIERIADEVIRTRSTCAVCGNTADHTQRIAPVEGLCMIGGPEAYQARCAKCFVAPPIELRR
jgi:thymidine kinase